MGGYSGLNKLEDMCRVMYAGVSSFFVDRSPTGRVEIRAP